VSRLEDSSTIEERVGARRHPSEHIARAVSAEERVYVMHSAECASTGIDLRSCAFSNALDNGIDMRAWALFQDRPVRVFIELDRLVPDARGAAVIEVLPEVAR
jgi:hypothetical protein